MNENEKSLSSLFSCAILDYLKKNAKMQKLSFGVVWWTKYSQIKNCCCCWWGCDLVAVYFPSFQSGTELNHTRCNIISEWQKFFYEIWSIYLYQIKWRSFKNNIIHQCLYVKKKWKIHIKKLYKDVMSVSSAMFSIFLFENSYKWVFGKKFKALKFVIFHAQRDCSNYQWTSFKLKNEHLCPLMLDVWSTMTFTIVAITESDDQKIIFHDIYFS